MLMVSLALIAALSLLGGYTAIEQANIALRNHESKATSLARQVAIASRNPVLTASLDQLEEMAQRLADSPEVLDLQIISPNGTSLTHVRRQGDASEVIYSPTGPRLITPASATPQLVHQPYRLVVWQPVVTHLLVAWVRLEYDTRELQALQWRIWRNTLVVSIVAVVACALVLAWVLRGPVRTLTQARQFAIAMTQAKGEQLPLDAGPIEVMELNQALNEASLLLQQQMMIIDDWLRQHQAHEARLAERNAQLAAIFSLSHDGLLTLDEQGHVLFANQAFMRLTNLPSEHVIGQPMSEVSDSLARLAQPGSDFRGLQAALDSTSSSEATLTLRAQTLMLGQGSARTVLSVTGQRSQHPSVSGVLYLSDITRQHTLDQMKSEFLSMAAHELRTPMVSIFGFTELMLHREMKPEQRKELLTSIHRHGQSMIAILNELLDLARIEARRGQDFRIEAMDLAQQVQTVLDDFKAPAGRELPSVAPLPGPMPVQADAHKLQQAVLNILSNAYKYSPQGGAVEVSFHSAPDDGGRLRHGVTIADHGIGMKPEDVARLGERFFRVDKSGNIPGTGLGVSIVQELMQLMGGRIQVDSTPGQGTRVTLWL